MTSPVSPSETIAKAMEGKNRIQGMVRSIDQYRNCDPKAIADGSYAQILYALTDDKNDILVLWGFAVSTALQLEAMQREMAELRALLSRAEEYIIDGVTNAKADAEMNAAYPARATRYNVALEEVRQLHAEVSRTLIQGEKK